MRFKTSFFGKLFTSQDSDPIKLRLGGSPLILQYLFFLVLCASETAGLQSLSTLPGIEDLIVGGTSSLRRCSFQVR